MVQTGNGWSTHLARQLMLKMLEKFDGGHLDIVCPERTYSFGQTDAELRATIQVHNERVFKRVLAGNDVGFGEAYMDGDWSSPNIVDALRLMFRNITTVESSHRLMSMLKEAFDFLAHKLRANTLTGSRKNIEHHYDLGNDFYRLFLDPTMAYSCGVYENLNDSLQASQINKFDLICRKLKLTPQDQVLEIGTGWGGFALYAAGQYGCKVTTTTISREQYEFSADRFARNGFGEAQIHLLYEDYRHLQGRFDKIVSIEMFEAVGYKFYDEYFGACNRLLKDDGAMLLQTITIPDQKFTAYRQRADWIQKYIFPGSELATLGGILASLKRVTHLTLFHMQDIGTHYARTLNVWRERFHKTLEAVRALGFDERFIRMWDYYLASCEAAFLERQISDCHLLLSKNFTQQNLFEEPWEALDDYQRPRRELAVCFD
ncbi:MAG: class I SAM-dependent methyltransferase [Acidobacteria bacterium]|nr:class I SAM-dependent methyltransferase [Acidobacteriota bacterium]